MTPRVPFVILGVSVPKAPTVPKAPKPNCEVIKPGKKIRITLWGEHFACFQNIRKLLDFLCQKLNEMKVDKSLRDAMQAAYTKVADTGWNGFKAITPIWVDMNTVDDSLMIANIFNKSVEKVDNWRSSTSLPQVRVAKSGSL